MDTKELIERELGGRKKVMEETGLSKGRISQWIKEDEITHSWLMYFKERYKRVRWGDYTGDKPH